MAKGNILVTGGAGYVGSHACKALARAGYVPICFDSMVRGHEWAVRWGPLVKGDVLDRNALDRAIKAFRPHAVMHFAAFAYVGESVLDPGKYYRNNVGGALTLLEALRDHGITKLVFSSTCSTYGIPEILPIPETHAQRPINPYGFTKLVVEQALRDFDLAHGLKSVSLRYFNAAGADPEGEVGEAHDPETHLIPLVLDAAAGMRAGITIYGTDYETPDGTCVRDYIHVSDLADAHVLALRALEGGSESSVYNLGNGTGFSVREVIQVAKEVTGASFGVDIGARRQGDPACLVGDSTRIRQELGWAPRLAGLAEIIGTAWRWHRRWRGSEIGQVPRDEQIQEAHD